MTLPAIVDPETGEADVFERIRTEIGEASAQSEKPASERSLVIAILPRTGSTALCSLLERTGVLGRPDEYLNPRGPLQLWARRLRASNLEAYLDLLRRERASENGIFSLKVTFDDLEPFVAQGVISAAIGPPTFVYLTRDDLVAQAISEYLAERSGVWHRDQAGELYHSYPDPGQGEPEFDPDSILAVVDRLVRMGRDWERFFALYSVDPLRVSYERFCADPSGTVRAIANHAGVGWDGEVDLSMSATSKLGDERNAEWARRFRSRYTL